MSFKFSNFVRDKRNLFFISIFIYLSIVSFGIIFLETFFGIKLNLFFPNDRYADFFKTIDGLKLAEVWESQTIYDRGLSVDFFPPVLVLMYYIFAKIIVFSQSAIFAFLLYISIPLIALYFSLKKYIFSNIQLILIFTSFPVLFTIERGNPAIWVVAFIFLALHFRRNIFLSVLFLAFAVSLKITPVIFLLAIISSKRKSAIIQVVSFFLILILINVVAIFSLKNLPTNYNPFNFFSALKIYENLYIDKLSGLNYGASLFMPIYFLFNRFSFNLLNEINPYLLTSVFCFLVFFVKCQKYFWDYVFKFTWARIDILSIIFILFTPVTGIYYLLLILFSLLIRFDELENNELYCYFLLLCPKVIVFHGIEFGAFLNPLLLLFLMINALESDISKFKKI